MSYSYSLTSTSRGGRGDDVTSFPPEMDDAMMEDRLEQARLNRTNYYRRMLASRTRPLEDHLVSSSSSSSSRKSTGSRSSPGRSGGASISDTPGTVPVPEIPQPHCSWRFYTSYDNGEWKRHAVPVDHDVDEILREPTKTPRRERDKVSPPPSALELSSSSIRRARQAGGPLLACIQPRAKRTSESSNDLATTATARAVGFQGPGGQAINGMDAQLVGQLGPAELMGLCGGNQELVRQILEGGLVVPFDGENHPPGNVKQEFSSKYMSTVTTTQPAGGVRNQGAQREGGAADVAKAESDGAGGVTKSRRPRIYGFQEKIIIPTKYKTAVENQENDVTAAKTDSTGHHSGSKVNQDAVKVNGVVSSGADDVKTETRVAVVGSSTVRSSPGRTMTSPGSQTVKVVVVNSGSDVESDRSKEVEAEEQKKKEEGGELAEAVEKEPGKTETFAPFVIQEGLTPMENFQAFQDNFRRQFENSGAEKKDGVVVEKKEEEKKGASSSSHPGQRLFSKDEQTFSDLGPDGQKRDGKVVRTYEVVTTTTTDGDPSPPKVEEGPVSIKEIPITPVAAVRSQSAAILSPPGAVQIVREDGARGTSPFGAGGGRRSVEIVREHGGSAARSPLAARRTIVEESSISSSSPKEGRRGGGGGGGGGVRTTSGGGDVSIFDQTGSLFKQISPRPRAEREREFASPRDTRHQWSRDQGVGIGGSGGGGGYTGRAASTTTTTTTATRTRTDGSEEQPEGARRKVVIVREMDIGAGGAVDEGGSEGRCSATSSRKTVEIVGEGDGGRHPGIVFREPDGKADQSGTRTSVKIVRETGCPSGVTERTVRTSWETGSGISSSEGATSFGDRVLFASSTGKEKPDPVKLASPPPPSGPTAKQSSCVGDKDTSTAEQWEVQVAVKD